jgi:hypothetical protein
MNYVGGILGDFFRKPSGHPGVYLICYVMSEAVAVAKPVQIFSPQFETLFLNTEMFLRGVI